jgi:hypothetical protein
MLSLDALQIRYNYTMIMPRCFEYHNGIFPSALLKLLYYAMKPIKPDIVVADLF